jgi:hypothetical protein
MEKTRKLRELPHKPRESKDLGTKLLQDRYAVIARNAPRDANAYHVGEEQSLASGIFYPITYFKVISA